MPQVAAQEHFLRGEPVTLGLPVAFADAAVVAIVFADVGKFDQPPDKHSVAIFLQAGFLGGCPEKLGSFRVPVCKQEQQVLVRQVVGGGKLFHKDGGPAHERTPE